MGDVLRDMVVLITGVASPIGRAVAELLAARGSRLVISDPDPYAVTDVTQHLAAQPPPSTAASDIESMTCDVRDEDQCSALVTRSADRFGKIDALVHCQSVLCVPGRANLPLHETEDMDYDTIIGTNLRGTFFINRVVCKKMMESRTGQIINIGSTVAHRGRANASLYCAAKAGLIGLTESVEEEARPFGIRASVIMPEAGDAFDTGKIAGDHNVRDEPSAISPQRVAEVVAFSLSVSSDIVCENLMIRPARLVKGRGKSGNRGPKKDAQA
jgi:3-oxoacyl-[acyl-carrier protein] reductase